MTRNDFLDIIQHRCLRSHSETELVQAFHAGESIWILDTGSDGDDDVIVGDRLDVMSAVIAHHDLPDLQLDELYYWPTGWNLWAIVLAPPNGGREMWINDAWHQRCRCIVSTEEGRTVARVIGSDETDPLAWYDLEIREWRLSHHTSYQIVTWCEVR